MSYQFEAPSEAQAERLLRDRRYGGARLAEGYHDAVAGQHALGEVTTAAERAGVRAFVLGRSYPCVGCNRFAFPDDGTLCFWCRR